MMSHKAAALAFIAAALAGCTAMTPPPAAPAPTLAAPAPAVLAKPVVITVEVPKPVPEKCQARIGRKPRFADEDADTSGAVYEHVAALRAGIAQRKAWERDLEAALAACGVRVR